MPASRSSWLQRWLGLALARRSLRRHLHAGGPDAVAALAAVVAGAPLPRPGP
jgi:hypothetical protein